MSNYSLTSPVTGSAQTGLTSPTYTLSDDIAPGPNGVQQAVTALGGTQTDVTVNSVSRPFTITFTRPKALKVPGQLNANGYLTSVPRNDWKLNTRKGVTPASGQLDTVAMIQTIISVPVGADTYDDDEIRAMLSLHIGALSAESAGIGDAVTSGVM